MALAWRTFGQNIKPHWNLQMKENINPLEYSSYILNCLKTGILLTTRNRHKINTMTIAWGMMGIEWQLPIFITYVRTHRFSHECLEQFPEFTINAPIGNFDKHIIGIAGTKSGRDMDKIETLNLHPIKSEKISVPGLAEFPLTLECKVIYKQHQDKTAIPQYLRESFHPENRDPYTSVLNGDYHTAYYGEIVAAYIIK